MSTGTPQARDGADLQVGDTVRYNHLFNDTLVGIIVGLIPAQTQNRYYVFTRTPDIVSLPIVNESHIRGHINTDYRGMSGEYILALHGESDMQLFDI